MERVRLQVSKYLCSELVFQLLFIVIAHVGSHINLK